MPTDASERLKQARAAAGYPSTAAAARAFGWEEAGYRHHENGTRGFFDIENAVRYARALRTSPAYLIGLSSDRASGVDQLSAQALGDVIAALLQAYAPGARVPTDDLPALGEALKETLHDMVADPAVGADATRSATVAQAHARARRRAA